MAMYFLTVVQFFASRKPRAPILPCNLEDVNTNMKAKAIMKSVKKKNSLYTENFAELWSIFVVVANQT